MRKLTITFLILSALLLYFIGKSPVSSSMEEAITKKLTASADRIYVLARESRLVRILDVSGKELKQFEIVTPYSRAQSDPIDIAFGEETLYVLDAEFSEIWCYTSDGVYTHNLPLVRQYLESPSALYVHQRGLLIADTGCVWVTDLQGHVVDRVSLPPDANGVPAIVTDITVTGTQPYFADAISGRILTASGSRTEKLSDGRVVYGGLGQETGRFMQLSGITSNGNLYAADALTGEITGIHSLTGQPSLISYPNQAITHPTDILFWRDQLWIVERNSEKLIKVETGLKPSAKRSILSVNLLDFGTWSENTATGLSFSVWSVDGTPITGSITSSNLIFKLDKTQFTEETNVTVVVSPSLYKIKEGTRETGTITVKLDTGDVQTIEVRARKKDDADFQILYETTNTDLVGKGFKIPIRCRKQHDLTGNLEFSFGVSTIPFDYSWELQKMPFLNNQMTNHILCKPFQDTVSGFYSLPITVKCPETKTVKQLTITFFYRGMEGVVPGTLLGEYFAAEWCEYCPAGNMALTELHRKYTKDEIVFVTYYNDCIKEMPERLCFPEGDVRMKWYTPVGLHVALILNGTTIKEGGYNDGVTTMTKEYDELIKGLSPMKSPVSLFGSADWDETNRKLTVGATLECLQDLPWKNPRLYCILAEHGIRYDAQNGVKVHDYVMRDFLALPNPEKNDAFGSPVWGVDGEILSKASDQWQGMMETTVDPLVKMENAFCILFVQDNETKQVYQARYIPLYEEPTHAMDWVKQRKTIRLNQDQTGTAKAWLINRGNRIDRYTLSVNNRKPFFGEDTWKVGGNEYSIMQDVSVTLSPMESILVEFTLNPVWGKPETPVLDIKAVDSVGNQTYCRMNVRGTEQQPRFEVLYPDPSILEREKGYTIDRNNFSCVIRTEPGTYIESNSLIKASADGILLVPLTGCYQSNQYGISLVYPDQQTQSVTFYYTFTLTMKMQIGSRIIWINREFEEIEAAPFIRNGRTMVPIRIVVENLMCGAKIDWDVETHDITITYKDGVIVIPEGQYYVIVQGKSIKLDVPPENVNGRVFLPIRFFAETLGAIVEWDAKTQTITIR